MERKDSKASDRLNDDGLSLATMGGSRDVEYLVLQMRKKNLDLLKMPWVFRIIHTVRKQREMNVGAQLTLSFLTQSLDPSQRDGVPTFRVIFPSSVKPL